MSTRVDGDGDSEMGGGNGTASSPETEPDLFPDHDAANPNEPVTPTDNNYVSPVDKLKMEELSPPTSQDPPGHDGSADAPTTFTLSSMENYRAKDPKMADEPGATWTNKKAREDYQRALSEIVDKDFNLKEFGDPFGDDELDGPNQKNGGR